MFVPGMPFQPGLRFVSKAGARNTNRRGKLCTVDLLFCKKVKYCLQCQNELIRTSQYKEVKVNRTEPSPSVRVP